MISCFCSIFCPFWKFYIGCKVQTLSAPAGKPISCQPSENRLNDSVHRRRSDVAVILAGEEILASVTEPKEEEIPSAFQQASEKKNQTSLMSRFRHSRLLLMLNTHPNTAFWQRSRGAGANARWGSGTKC